MGRKDNIPVIALVEVIGKMLWVLLCMNSETGLFLSVLDSGIIEGSWGSLGIYFFFSVLRWASLGVSVGICGGICGGMRGYLWGFHFFRCLSLLGSEGYVWFFFFRIL